ncbi:MAG: SMC-Scp complex subunit ScpB [Treponema sp.]|jgi:segregation and condensation protein B|nr:SMC-Scp complex subunit ScpB [Treponema sp.]
MELRLEKETALIEAILYLEADPLDKAALIRISGLAGEAVERALANLEDRYGREDSGVALSRIGGGIMIAPKKEYWELLKERYGKKNEARLSRAAMETLSIIAYSQPVTQSEIKAIRGVSADNMIRLLIEKGLIREAGKKDVPGKPIQYGTTREFLKLFRLESIADLPKLNESEIERFELIGQD